MKYRIAGLVIECEASAGLDSFQPFWCEDGEPVMHFDCNGAEINDKGSLMDEFTNDAGTVRLHKTSNGYLILLRYEGGPVHAMSVSSDFSCAKASIRTDDPHYDTAINSLIRIAFSQRILFYEGFLIHASSVVKDDRAYLFLGRSGTGKSTHSQLWLGNIPGAWLLNDDNPVVRLVDGIPFAFGSPWSGKLECYKDEAARIRGIARINRGMNDCWEDLSGARAWAAVFPSCSRINQDDLLYLYFTETLNRVISGVKVGRLTCLPDADAAILAYNSLK